MRPLSATALLAAVAVAPLVAGTVPLLTDHVVLNELYPNPPGSSELGREWFELYNPGALPVALDGWSVTDHGTCAFHQGRWPLPQGTSLGPQARAQFVLPSNSGICLGNSGDDLTLLDASNATVDDLWYGNGGPHGPDGAAPLPAEGQSLARCEVLAGSRGPNLDDGVPAHQFYVDPVPTPGAMNRVCLPPV